MNINPTYWFVRNPFGAMAIVFALTVSTDLTPIAHGQQTATASSSIKSTDWPWWRGPSGDGIAPAGQQPPTKWSETENVLWRAAVPGRGHGSATVLGDQVFLATADESRDGQFVLCFDRNSGNQVWETAVHQGGLKHQGKRKPNEKASLASSTVATNGQLLYINFLNDGAVWTSALSRAGDIVWQKKISDYVIHQGYGSSPTVYQDLVIVAADNKSGGAVVALDQTTGTEVWRRGRPTTPNYPSPVVLMAAGREQLIMTGCNLVTSLDPASGKELWEIEGATTECVTSTVTDGKHVFTTGGFPKNHIAAVAADGSGTTTWEVNTRAYVPSLLIKDQHLFAVLDAGVATCMRCDTGEEVWKARLGGTFSSSPVMVNDLIYATNEDGETFIFRARTDKFELVAKNQLGESVFATPAICGNQIFTRVAHHKDGQRNEYLYCLAKE
tara:strand:+ start:278485 stop:279810 length:1326 start_codon:yes stop_codon:yes gene_type:complete